MTGDRQSGAPGETLGEPLRVGLYGADGRPLADVDVLWRVVEGGGDIPGPRLLVDGVPIPVTVTMTDGNGVAEAAWVLGPEAGPNRVEASAFFANPTVRFSARAEE